MAGADTAGPARSWVTRTFPAEAESVASARRWAMDFIGEWGIEPGVVLLTVSELVTNAVVHGAPPIRIQLSRVAGGLRVSVSDGAEGALEPRRPPPSATTGRGLEIVDHLTSRWGVRSTPGYGKVVWAELPSRYS